MLGRWHCVIKTPWSLEVEFHKVRSYLYCGRAVFFSLRWSECPCWILYCSSSPKSYQAIRFITKLQLTIRSHSYIHSTYLKLGDADGIGDGILIESSNKLGKLDRCNSITMAFDGTTIKKQWSGWHTHVSILIYIGNDSDNLLPGSTETVAVELAEGL